MLNNKSVIIHEVILLEIVINLERDHLNNYSHVFIILVYSIYNFYLYMYTHKLVMMYLEPIVQWNSSLYICEINRLNRLEI